MAGFWNRVREHFSDPTPARQRRQERTQQREELRHHERDVWREGASEPYAPPEQREHPTDPPRGHGGGGW
jgi:hypothetical protein